MGEGFFFPATFCEKITVLSYGIYSLLYTEIYVYFNSKILNIFKIKYWDLYLVLQEE